MNKVKLSETIWWNLWNDTQTSFDFNTAWPTYTGRLKVAIVGGVDQSLGDNCTMFPYLTQPILVAKFETRRQEKWITIYVLLSNNIKAIPVNGASVYWNGFHNIDLLDPNAD